MPSAASPRTRPLLGPGWPRATRSPGGGAGSQHRVSQTGRCLWPRGPSSVTHLRRRRAPKLSDLTTSVLIISWTGQGPVGTGPPGHPRWLPCSRTRCLISSWNGSEAWRPNVTSPGVAAHAVACCVLSVPVLCVVANHLETSGLKTCRHLHFCELGGRERLSRVRLAPGPPGAVSRGRTHTVCSFDGRGPCSRASPSPCGPLRGAARVASRHGGQPLCEPGERRKPHSEVTCCPWRLRPLARSGSPCLAHTQGEGIGSHPLKGSPAAAWAYCPWSRSSSVSAGVCRGGVGLPPESDEADGAQRMGAEARGECGRAACPSAALRGWSRSRSGSGESTHTGVAGRDEPEAPQCVCPRPPREEACLPRVV